MSSHQAAVCLSQGLLLQWSPHSHYCCFSEVFKNISFVLDFHAINSTSLLLPSALVIGPRGKKERNGLTIDTCDTPVSIFPASLSFLLFLLLCSRGFMAAGFSDPVAHRSRHSPAHCAKTNWNGCGFLSGDKEHQKLLCEACEKSEQQALPLRRDHEFTSPQPLFTCFATFERAGIQSAVPPQQH